MRHAVDALLQKRQRPGRQVARERGRIPEGEDVEAAHVQRVVDCLARERAAEDHHVAGRPGREDRQADHRGDRDEPEPLAGGRALLRGREDHQDPGDAQPGHLVAGQRGEPEQDAEQEQTRIAHASPPRLPRQPRHEQAGAQGEDREQCRRVRQGRVEDERQIDGRCQPGAQREHPAATGRQPALEGDVGAQAPRQDGDERTGDDRHELGGREGWTEQLHRDGGEQRRQWQPHLERRAWHDEGRRLVAPDGVGDQAAPLHEVPRDAEVVRRVLRGREDDKPGRHDAGDQRDKQDREGR